MQNTEDILEDIELETVEKIKKRCMTGDKEGNGCELDLIISEFLGKLNMINLQEAFNSVEAWRS